MITYQQQQDFDFCYSFAHFTLATGLKAPLLSKAYNNFQDFTMQYIKDNGFAAITEAFEAWSCVYLEN